MSFRSMALTLGAALVATAGIANAGTGSLTYEEALAKATAADKPVLLKIGAEWCSACNAFDKAVAENTAFRSSIANGAILCQIDGEKGDGVDIAHRYGVQGFPTFVLANAEGELMDRWVGYKNTERFEDTLADAQTDMMTLQARLARFSGNPNETDAVKLGNLRLAEGHYGDAHAFYRRAATLNPDANHEGEVFMAMSYGARKGLFGPDDVKAQADAIYGSEKSTGKDLLEVLWTMRTIAAETGHSEYFVPYLKTAYEKTEGSADEHVQMGRSKLAADYALHVEKDERKAIEAKRTSMPEGWTANANMLNSFAWWCFENKVNLEEAETFARKGVELAENDQLKAMILDTVAEICNVKGDCGESLELIRLAINADPENDYYRAQEERFADLFAQQQKK